MMGHLRLIMRNAEKTIISNADMSLPIETILLIIQISMELKRHVNIDNRDENSIWTSMEHFDNRDET